MGQNDQVELALILFILEQFVAQQFYIVELVEILFCMRIRFEYKPLAVRIGRQGAPKAAAEIEHGLKIRNTGRLLNKFSLIKAATLGEFEITIGYVRLPSGRIAFGIGSIQESLRQGLGLKQSA